jgi:ABC-2 type transport system ATP-binding protein
VRNLEAAREALIRAGFAPRIDGGKILLTEARALRETEEVATLLVSAGTPPSRLVAEQESLEAHFLQLTGERL